MSFLYRFSMAICLVSALISVTWGCNTNQTLKGTYHKDDIVKGASGAKNFQETICVDVLVNNALSFKDKIVAVRGKYMGWQGSCISPPPETRSDWMLEYGKECIYVSGPIPLGIERPPNSKDLGREIDVRGKVLFNGSGTPYIKIITK